MKINMCKSFISHASILMPLELNYVGSSDLLFVDSYDTLIQSHAFSNSRTWRYLFWKQKSWKLPYAQSPPMSHIYMRVFSMIPHSYLVHFELVQTYCLSSYAMHISYFDRTHTWHQSMSVMINHTKAHHPPETKRKQVKWVIMLMDPRLKKEKGEDDKSSVSVYTCTWSRYLNRIAT